MATRRAFLSRVGAASAAAVAFHDRAIEVVEAAGAAAGGASPAEMAGNEDYWREIQGAFTLDRTMINLNNGGVCPSPRVVMDALKRYLDQSNQAPVWNMWQQLEPGIEGVRRDLAAEFGCDPEEMAITRNASESLEICIMGLDLKPGDEILTTNQDLDCDFYGVSLHKWMLAPIGTGFLYVKKNRIKGLWPLMAAEAKQDDDIRKYEEIGTHPAANHNAIAEAIVFHRGIGVERKAARFRYLRDRFMKRLAANPKFVINTSFDPQMSCAIANVGIRGVDTGALQAHLWGKKRIFTVAIIHPEFQGLRITPNVYTTVEEIDAFASEMEAVAAKGLPA